MNNLEMQITNAQSEEELLQILANAGMSITSTQLHAAMESGAGELAEDAMESVSGGCALPWIIIHSWYTRRGRSGGASGGGGGSSW